MERHNIPSGEHGEKHGMEYDAASEISGFRDFDVPRCWTLRPDGEIQILARNFNAPPGLSHVAVILQAMFHTPAMLAFLHSMQIWAGFHEASQFLSRNMHHDGSSGAVSGYGAKTRFLTAVANAMRFLLGKVTVVDHTADIQDACNLFDFEEWYLHYEQFLEPFQVFLVFVATVLVREGSMGQYGHIFKGCEIQYANLWLNRELNSVLWGVSIAPEPTADEIWQKDAERNVKQTLDLLCFQVRTHGRCNRGDHTFEYVTVCHIIQGPPNMERHCLSELLDGWRRGQAAYQESWKCPLNGCGGSMKSDNRLKVFTRLPLVVMVRVGNGSILDGALSERVDFAPWTHFGETRTTYELVCVLQWSLEEERHRILVKLPAQDKIPGPWVWFEDKEVPEVMVDLALDCSEDGFRVGTLVYQRESADGSLMDNASSFWN